MKTEIMTLVYCQALTCLHITKLIRQTEHNMLFERNSQWNQLTYTVVGSCIYILCSHRVTSWMNHHFTKFIQTARIIKLCLNEVNKVILTMTMFIFFMNYHIKEFNIYMYTILFIQRT